MRGALHEHATTADTARAAPSAGLYLEAITASRKTRLRLCGGAAFLRPPALIALGNQHRKLQRLLVVQPWIHRRPISPLQIRVRKAPRAARAFGHVITGELDVNTAEV